jgi:benzoate-CoA ligase
MLTSAADLGVPRVFNAAAHFVDRNVSEGRGDRIAIECGDDRLTYADVLANVNRFGSAIRQLGIRREERVMLLLVDGPCFASAFFGTTKIGAVAVPVNTLLKPHDYRYLLEDSGAVALVVSETLLPLVQSIDRAELPRLRHVIAVGRAGAGVDLTWDELMSTGSEALAAEPTSRDEAALWLYSSGSTGTPKGCVHLHHDMVVCAELFAKGVLGITSADRCFSVAKLFFAYGLGNALYFPFSVGATTILWPGPPTPANVYEVIERHRPTLFFSVPTGYGMLLAHVPAPSDAPLALSEQRESKGLALSEQRESKGLALSEQRESKGLALSEQRESKGLALSEQRESKGDFDLSSIRLAVSAGESLPPALFERFKQRFGLELIDGIGSTEALHMFISNRPGHVRAGSSGQLVSGYEARILDNDGQPVGTDEIGNLWIRGDSVCVSYWNQHEKTIETIQGPWLRTGDKYTVDADGYYWHAGRADDMLKVGGQWVSPVEVENVVLTHPAVQECGVVGYEDHDGLVKPIAFVVLRAGTDSSAERAGELEQFVRARIAEFKRPRRVVFLPELPKTATGKIQRFKLREMAAQGR